MLRPFDKMGLSAWATNKVHVNRERAVKPVELRSCKSTEVQIINSALTHDKSFV